MLCSAVDSCSALGSSLAFLWPSRGGASFWQSLAGQSISAYIQPTYSSLWMKIKATISAVLSNTPAPDVIKPEGLFWPQNKPSLHPSTNQGSAFHLQLPVPAARVPHFGSPWSQPSEMWELPSLPLRPLGSAYSCHSDCVLRSLKTHCLSHVKG